MQQYEKELEAHRKALDKVHRELSEANRERDEALRRVEEADIRDKARAQLALAKEQEARKREAGTS